MAKGIQQAKIRLVDYLIVADYTISYSQIVLQCQQLVTLNQVRIANKTKIKVDAMDLGAFWSRYRNWIW